MTSEDMIEELDLGAWVGRAPQGQSGFREAVHIILTAISSSAELRSKMVMKGGLLMAIRYESSRYTRDVDFSTGELYKLVDKVELLGELDRQLDNMNGRLQYDTMCRRQRTEVRPQKAGAKFQTLSLAIGYAPRSNAKELQRLLRGRSASVVEIDYSYNEAVLDVEILRLGNGDQLQAYSFLNLLAEKIRSLLQQPVRNRNRRQDVYDLFFLLGGCTPLTEEEQVRLLGLLLYSCGEREIVPTAGSLENPVIREMAEKDYDQLAQEIDGQLPAFAEAYEFVQRFYAGLPWQ